MSASSTRMHTDPASIARTESSSARVDSTLVIDRDPVRESMTALPGWLQLPLTMLTGKPHAHQRGPALSPGFHLAAACASMCSGLAVSGTALRWGGWWSLLLAVGWAMTLHGMRNLRMMIFHQSSHRNMFGQRSLDKAIGYAISSLLIIQNFDRYSREHVADHHALHHMTLRDPTVQAILISLDLAPGMSTRRIWSRVLCTLVSPRFHTRFFISRVLSFTKKSARCEKALAAVFHLGMVMVTALTGWWTFLVVAWLLPLVFFYQVSNTLRLCVKHTFAPPGLQTRRGKSYFAGLTNAIFIGEQAPTTGPWSFQRAWQWVRWSLRMAFLHFPSRYLVLTGDTVVHDFHHRHPASKKWPDYTFARQQDQDEGTPGWPAYTHVWGLRSAMNRVFHSISIADPTEYSRELIGSVSKRELFTAFDD